MAFSFKVYYENLDTHLKLNVQNYYFMAMFNMGKLFASFLNYVTLFAHSVCFNPTRQSTFCQYSNGR